MNSLLLVFFIFVIIVILCVFYVEKAWALRNNKNIKSDSLGIHWFVAKRPSAGLAVITIYISLMIMFFFSMMDSGNMLLGLLAIALTSTITKKTSDSFIIKLRQAQLERKNL